MSDFNSSLPVRTQANGDVAVKVVDGAIPAQQLTITAAGEAKVISSNLPTTVDTDYGAVGSSTIRSAAQVGNSTGAADFNNGATGAQTLRVAANMALGGQNVSVTNPVPVVLSSDPSGTEVNDYNTVAAVAASATSNHDYTVTAGKTLLLQQVEATASGKAKIEIQVETGVATDTFVTKYVSFNSTAFPDMSKQLKAPISVAAGVRVRVIRTNKDNQAQDLYSTIAGVEV